jgi:hypothetical protein
MKITLTDEQVNSLIEVEINKRVSEFTNKFTKELLKVQSQLTDALSIVNALVNNEVVNNKKEKLTPEVFIKLWESGKNTGEIAKELNFNSGYISQYKKKLVEQGKIVEREKQKSKE